MKHFAILGSAIIFAAHTSASQAKDQIYSTYVQANNGLVTGALAPYFKSINSETKGELKWRMMVGGQLLGARNALSGLKEGIADAAQVIPVFTRKELPANNLLFDMAVFGENILAGNAAAIETILLHCKTCMDEYKKHNSIFLGGYAGGHYTLMCTSPVKSLNDIKGKKVRIVGSLARLFKKIGAVPVTISSAEAVTAMQRGAIDCVVGTPSWLISWGYIDSVKHVLNFSFGQAKAMAFMVVNRRTWKSYSAKQKGIMIKNIPLASARVVINTYVLQDQKALKIAQEKGIEISKGGKDFAEARAAFLKSEMRFLPKYYSDRGLKDAEKIMSAYQTAYKKWVKISESIGLDVNAYAAAMQKEIYSKIDLSKL